MSELITDLLVCRQPGSFIGFACDDSLNLFSLYEATLGPSSLVKTEDGLCKTVQGPGQNSSVPCPTGRDLNGNHPNPPFW